MRGVPVIADEALKHLLSCIKAAKPQTVLEIGTAAGLSAIAIAQNSNAFIYTMEKDEVCIADARQNIADFGMSERVRIIEGDCVENIKEFDKKIDFIFLDGPKGQYLKMYPYLKNILNAGGILFCDNVLFRGFVIGESFPARYKTIVKNLREFLQIVKEDKDIESTVHDVGDGVLVARKLN